MGHESIAGDNQQSEQEGLRADRRLAEPASGGGISVRLHGRHLPEKELSGVIESIAILVAIGVNSDGNREVIGAAEGGREDKEIWIRFLRSLKDRGGARHSADCRCSMRSFRVLCYDHTHSLLHHKIYIFRRSMYGYCAGNVYFLQLY